MASAFGLQFQQLGLEPEVVSFSGADVAEQFTERFGGLVADDDAESDVAGEGIARRGIVGEDLVFQGIEVVIEGGGLDALGSFESPEGAGQFVGQEPFGALGGGERLKDPVAELFELFRVFEFEDHRSGGESMAKGVAAGDGFALLGAGSRALLRVGAIGGQTV
ncbi:MAG: hypothetical protein ACK58M_08295 [Acidobacteriota bacterium]|jgi:hypothetical protein|nr:hypothetical protein [Bryobacteraceae bacterium CoA2 C42]MCA2963938.1 hypothetical protein [Acidobacteriaceae bacterium]